MLIKVLFVSLFSIWIIAPSIARERSTDTVRYFLNPTVSLQPDKINPLSAGSDSDPYTLYQIVSREGYPICYFRKITQEVCFDKRCRMLEVNVYWTLTGRYLGIELLNGEFLSKTEHEPFTVSEYRRLNALLADSLSPLKDFTYEELVPDRPFPGTDAVTGATSKDVLNYVVEGAVFTTYTLWNIVYGDTQKEVREHTIRMLSPALLSEILKSTDVGDKCWALDRIGNAMMISEALRTQVSALIDDTNYTLKQCAINAFTPDALRSDTVQWLLYNKLTSSDYTTKALLINKLSDAPLIAPEIIQRLIRNLKQINGGLLVDVFNLLKKQPAPNDQLLASIATLLKDDNRFKANQAFNYLNSLEIKDSALQKSMQEFKSDVKFN